LQRRDLLRLALLAAAPGGLATLARAAVTLRSDPFSLGVASGSSTDSAVVLWTRLAPQSLSGGPDAAAAIRWELAHDEGFRQLVQTGQAVALPQLGHSVHVEVQGLQPDRWYHYRFLLGDAVSTTGRTRTFPQANASASHLKLAYASCQKWEDGYFTAWRHMQAQQVDAVLFLGDYIYEYPGRSSRLRVPGGGWVLTLDDYRARYALYKSDPDLQAMHASAPWLMTWDDHEVQNDYAGLHPGDSGRYSPTVADFAARRAAAYQAYYENMPLPASVLVQALQGLAQGAEMRLYRQLNYGRLASLLLLDARQYKDAQVCNPQGATGSSMVSPERCRRWENAQRTMLGWTQEQWLQQALASAAVQSARWTVLGQQTLFGPRNTGSASQPRYWNDGWDGYSAARRRLTDALQHSAAPNPVILGGDVHENWVGHVKADYARPESASVGVEFCGTSISSHSGSGDHTETQLALNPHFVFAEARHRGYGIAEFTPQRLEVSLRVLDDVMLADSGVQTLARFAVEAGHSVVERL
jgi:alkaline phosphatase D